MFDKIIFIGEQDAHIKLVDHVKVETDIMNMPLVLEDPEKSILAEVKDLQDGAVKVRLLGEIKNGKFIGGVLRKPSLNAKIRALEVNEFTLIVGGRKDWSLRIRN